MNWADRQYAIGRGVAAIRHSKSGEYNPFVRALLEFHLAGLLKSATGSTFPNVSKGLLLGLSVEAPPLEEQRAIAHVLGTLDDKIELNRRMNETLEAMARAIFKSWFVDFDPVIDNALRAGNPIPDEYADRAAARRESLDSGNPIVPEDIASLFPDAFQDSSLGPIPAGWRLESLHNTLKVIGGGTPKTSVDDYWGGPIPWFAVVDAPTESDVFVIDTERHVTEAGVENSSTKILPQGTTIISARGTVGKCALVGRPMAMNQSCYGLRGKDSVGDYFVYFTIRRNVADLQRKGHGSVFNTITRDTFKSIRVPRPSAQLTETFDDAVERYLRRVLANLEQSVTLAAIRDALLPKLLSGDIRVPDIEPVREETA